MADIVENPENSAVMPSSDDLAPAPDLDARPSAADEPGASTASPAPIANPSVAKRVIAYGKKNWWLILLPLPIIVIVVAFKHRRK